MDCSFREAVVEGIEIGELAPGECFIRQPLSDKDNPQVYMVVETPSRGKTTKIAVVQLKSGVMELLPNAEIVVEVEPCESVFFFRKTD